MANFENRTLFENDNLPVLRALDADSVDLIYLDPPFNSNQDYAAPIGSEAAARRSKILGPSAMSTRQSTENWRIESLLCMR